MSLSNTEDSANDSWSSGWLTVTSGTTETLTHNLGGDVDDYVVEMRFWNTDTDGIGVNVLGLGGFEHDDQWQGAFWSNLTDSTVAVRRYANDEAADRIRVRIWIPDPPDYDSGWQAIDQGNALTLTHSLGSNAEDYAISLWFKDTDGNYGINQQYFGGVEIDNNYTGARWQQVTDSAVKVVRFSDDESADQVRLRITKPPSAPTYDSGWAAIEPDQLLTLTHNVGLRAASYQVRLQYRVFDLGQTSLWAGGEADGDNLVGGNWQRLTNATIEVYRQPAGALSTEIRIRIWVPTVYLPLIVRY